MDVDALAIADRFFAAIMRGDVDTVRDLYAPSAVIWHNFDLRTQTRDENLALLGWVVRNVKELRYDNIRRQRTETGFVQQHVLRGVGPDGTRLEIAACIVCSVEAGRITRLDEYLDSAQIQALSR